MRTMDTTPTPTAPASPDTPVAPPVRRSSPATDLALVAAFAALIVACALLPAIPTGGAVPITLQTFAVLLSGAVLGARRGFLAVLLYLGLGAIGLPVFAQGAGGIGVFAGASVGYLIGFPLAAALTGFLVERLPRGTSRPVRVLLLWVCGLAGSFAFIHTCGILGMYARLDLTLVQAWKADRVFIPGDLVKNLAMALVATSVHAAFPDLLPRRGRAAATGNARGTIAA